MLRSVSLDRRPVLAHLLSTAALALAYVLFAFAHANALIEQFRLSLVLLVVFESVMVVLIFFRRPPSVCDYSPMAVAVGLLGGLAPLAFRPAIDADDTLVGQFLLFLGLLGLVGSSISIRRSFGLIPANRGVQHDGLYRLVRHPFYLSYLIAQLGYVVNNPSAPNLAVLLVGLAFQVGRIWFEERLLLDDPVYRRYAERVRWHLIPGVW